MNLANLSIKRPIFISCIVILMLSVGILALKGLGVDLFPNVTFPVVVVSTPYPGAGPTEIETLISKPLEDEISTLSGIKTLRSINREGVSIVVARFTLETDIKYAEQQVRDRVAMAKTRFPTGTKEPIIRKLDPAESPILILTLSANLAAARLYDIADQQVKPGIQQVNQVGLVDILGGRKREIRVELDRRKLKSHELSASQVSARIAASGQNIPMGKVDQGENEIVFRTLGEFHHLDDIGSTIVNFLGNDVPVTVSDLGRVVDGIQDEKSRTAFNGTPGLTLMVYRQSGTNTIAVVDAVKARIAEIQRELDPLPGKPRIDLVWDGSKGIRANVDDVKESILLGIVLTILVVYFFLGSTRSTLITGLALPNSLIGSFILMAAAGFSINVMTLLALSLAVGLLIDDAIVVRENIFRHIEEGAPPIKAAVEGTRQVTLAVIATTLTVIAVFGPIAFLQGIVGQFFREFGLTICFAMMISLFDALTMAPMLSAYFAGSLRKKPISRVFRPIRALIEGFGRFQDRLEDGYQAVLRLTLKHPVLVLGAAVLVFFASIASTSKVPKMFLPPHDFGEFMVSLDMPPGTNLDTMTKVSAEVDKVIRSNREISNALMISGDTDGTPNVATFYVNLVPANERKGINTGMVKERIRQQLAPFARANPIVKDMDLFGGGERPFNVSILGNDLDQLETVSRKVFERLRNHPGLKDVDLSYRPGKPEFQVLPDRLLAERLGVSTAQLGLELRTQIEGSTPAVFRENGLEYDIRVRLNDSQRDLRKAFNETYVPNVNGSLVRVSSVARPVTTTGPASINREDRARYMLISADVAPNGPGMEAVMRDISRLLEKDMKLPPGMSYRFVGQAESFQELKENMAIAALLGTLFIYLVLASLYESFIMPFTIMLVLPLAACGAFLALFITRSSLDIFSMIGCIMLLGIATKNSILLVDYTHQLVEQGMERSKAILLAGKTRLRPILMTTAALIAGMLPIALGLNEASRQRTSMGIAVIGGLISSTLLTLVVVPAAYSYIDRFRLWIGSLSRRVLTPQEAAVGPYPAPHGKTEGKAAEETATFI